MKMTERKATNQKGSILSYSSARLNEALTWEGIKEKSKTPTEKTTNQNDPQSKKNTLSMQLDEPLRICDNGGNTLQEIKVLNFKQNLTVKDIIHANQFFNLGLASGAIKDVDQNMFLFNYFQSCIPLLDLTLGADQKITGTEEVLFSDLVYFAGEIAPEIIKQNFKTSSIKEAEKIVSKFRPIASVMRDIKKSSDDFVGIGAEILEKCLVVDLDKIKPDVFLACCYKLVEVCRVKKTQ
jgi:hypothetical protein